MNAQQFTDLDVQFEFQPTARVSTVYPVQGIREGGTLGTVKGTAFSSRSAMMSYIHCRFNNTIVRALYYSASKLVCTPPTMAEAYAAVEVTNNDRDYSGDGVLFEFVQVSVTMLSPWHGPKTGSTTVASIFRR